MSNQTVTNNGNQAKINTDLSRVFLWENRYSSGAFNNSLYDPLVMPAGTVLGRISTSQKLALCASGNTDGSQIPVGVLAQDVTIEEGVQMNLSFCNFGDVSEGKLVFHGTDTLNTIVAGQSYRDRLHNIGLKLVAVDEMTGFDN